MKFKNIFTWHYKKEKDCVNCGLVFPYPTYFTYFICIYILIMINDNDYSNPCDESNENKTKIKEWITKTIKVLLTCVIIKTTIIEIINTLVITIMIIIAIWIINNSNIYYIMKIM